MEEPDFFDPKAFLNPRDVADLLQVSDRTVSNWRQKKTGPRYIKLAGGRIRYHRSDVQDFILKSRRGGPRRDPDE
jgi:predicted DNA-binding transcriptional regulator AlpA